MVVLGIAMLLIHTPCPSKGQRPADVLASALDQPRLPSLGFWQLLLAAFYFVARCAAGNGLLGCLSAALCHTATLLAAHELVALLSEPAPAPGLAGMTASGAHSPIGAADGAGTPQLSLRRSASSTSALQSPRRPSTSGQMLPPSARRSHAGPGELVVGGMALEHSDTSPIVTPAGGRARAGTVGAQLHANGGGYTDLRRSLPAGLSPGPSLPRSSSATASMHTKLMTTGSGSGGVPHSPVVPLRSYGSAGREALVGAAGMVTSALPTLDVGGLGDLAPPTGSRQHSSVHASPGAANRQSKTRSLAGGSPEGASPATKRGVSESGGGAVGLGLGEGTLLPQAGSIQGRRSSGGGPEASGSAGEARTEPGAVVASAGHSSNGGASLPLGDRAAGEGGTEEGADRPLGQEQSSAESSHCRVCSEELHAFRSHLPATRPLSPVEEGHSGPLAQPRRSTSGRPGGPRHHRRASSHRVSGSTHDYIMLASTVPGGDCCPPYRPPNGAFAPRGLDVEEEEEEEEYDSEAYNDDDSDGCFSLVLDANGNPNPNGAAHAPGAQVLVSATANGPSGGAGINPRASTGGLWPGQVGPDAAAWAAAHGGSAGAASPGAGGLVRKHSHALHGVVPHPPDVYGCDVADLADLEDLMSLEEVEAVAAAEDSDLVAGASGGSRPPTRGGTAAAAHSLGAVGRPGGPFAGLELCTGLGAGADSSMVAEDSYCGITTGPATPAHPAGPLGGALLPGPLRSRLGATGEGAAPGGADGAGAEGGLQAQGSVPLQEDTLARHTAASLAATAATAAAAAQAAARRSTGGAVDPALLPLLAPAGTSGELMDCFLRDAAMLVNGGYDTYDETESDVELLTTTTNTAATSSRHASRQPASGRGPAQALGAKAQAGWAEDEGDQEGDSSGGDRAGGSGGGSAQREQLQAMSRGQLLARQIYGAPPPEFLPFPLRDASAHPAAVFLPAPAVAAHHRSGAAIVPPPLPPPQQQQQQLRHSVGHVAHHGPSGHAEVVLVPSPHAAHASHAPQLQPQHAQQLALARSSRRSAATASASPNTTGAAGFVDGDLQPPQPSQGRSSGAVARLPGSTGHISPARAAAPPPLVALPHSQRHSMDSARHSHPSLAAAPDAHVPLAAPRGVGGGGYALPGLPPPAAAPAATAFLLQADQLRWEEMETFGLDEGSSGGVGGHGVQGNGSGGDGQGRPNLLRGSSSEPQWPSPGPAGPGEAQRHHGQAHAQSHLKPGPVQRQRSHSHCQALHAQHVAQHAAQHAPHAQHGLLKTHAHGHSLSHSHLPPYLGHQPLHRGGHHGRLMSPQEGDEEGSGEADGNDMTPTQHMSNRQSNFLSHPFDEPGAHLLKAVTVCGAVRGSPGDPRGFVGSAGGAVPARPTLVNPFECAGQMQYRSLSFQHLNQPPHYDLHHRTASSRVSAFSPPGAAGPLGGAATPATGAAAATAADAVAAPPPGALTTQTSDGGASTAVSGAATAPAVTAAGAAGDSMYSVAAAASSLSGHDTRPTPPPTAMAGAALGPAASLIAPGPADGSLAAADPAPATEAGDSAGAKDGLASTQEPQQGAPASPSPSLPLPPLGFGAIGAHLAAVKTMGGSGMGSSGGGAVLAAFAAVGSDVASPLAPSEAAAAAAAAGADLPPELPPAPSASSMVTRLTLPSVDGWPAHCPGGGGGVFSPPLHGSWGAAFFQGEGEGESDEEGDTPAGAERRRSRAAGGASATATAGVAADGAAAAAGTAVGPEA